MPAPGGTTRTLSNACCPAQEAVALAVAPVLEVDVRLVRLAGPEQIDLYRVIDDQVDGNKRVHDARVAALAIDGASHRGEIHHRGHAREILHQHAAGHERDVLGLTGPPRERRHVVGADVSRASTPEQVLEQDLQRVRESLDLTDALVREPPQPRDLDVAVGGGEARSGAVERIGHRSPSSMDTSIFPRPWARPSPGR
jgi:hypothetical protein